MICGGDELDSPSLRDQVDDDEILALFTDDADDIKMSVRRLVSRVREDVRLEANLIEALSTAVEEKCDDSQASIWIIVVLGEARSQNSIEVLLRALVYDDEILQDAATVALLRIGGAAIVRLLEWIDEDYGFHFNRVAYRVLGETGILEDAMLHERIVDVLEERWPAELRAPPRENAIEELAGAFARLGHRRQLPALKDVLAKVYGGCQPCIEDAIAIIEENVDGVAFVPTIPPWEDRYGWIFEDELQDARVSPLEEMQSPRAWWEQEEKERN